MQEDDVPFLNPFCSNWLTFSDPWKRLSMDTIHGWTVLEVGGYLEVSNQANVMLRYVEKNRIIPFMVKEHRQSFNVSVSKPASLTLV